MTDVHVVVRDQLRSLIDRIERLEEEKKAIADDIKDVKSEAKGLGFNVGAINAIIKLRKKDANERAEEEAILDTYMAALGMIPQPDLFEEPHDRETGEVFDNDITIIDRDDEDGNHLTVTVDARVAAILASNPSRPSTNDKASPEAGPQAEASPAGTGSGTLADRDGRHEGEAASVDLPTRSDGGLNIVHKHTEIATASQGEAEAPSVERVSPAETNTGSAAANIGGDHVTDHQSFAAQAGASVQVAPAIKHRFRPNCQHRDHCRSGTADHCHSCKQAMREGEAA